MFDGTDNPRPPLRPRCALYLDLTGRECVVVGGGSVAERRVRSLLDGGASVTVIAPSLTTTLRDLAEAERIHAEFRTAIPADVEGAFLVVCASANADTNLALREAAAERRVLVNAADNPNAGDVIVPATLRRGHLGIAVTTLGASPIIARRVRDEIAAEYDDSWGVYIEAVGKARSLAITRLSDPDLRTAVLRYLGSSVAHQIVACDPTTTPEALLQAALDAADNPESETRR